MQVQSRAGILYRNPSIAPFSDQRCPPRNRSSVPSELAEIEFDDQVNPACSFLQGVLTEPIFDLRMAPNFKHGVRHNQRKPGQMATPDRSPSGCCKATAGYSDAQEWITREEYIDDLFCPRLVVIESNRRTLS